MISFETFASSSAGNLYRVTSPEGSPLLLECGIPIKKILKALKHRLHDIAGVLLSHEHMDHAKSTQNLLNYGVDVYCSKGTADALGITGHHRVHIIEALKQFSIGPWIILPFEAKHDAAEPLGFLIQNGKYKLLFCADSFYIKHRFAGLTHIAVECNYSRKTLNKDLPLPQKKRLFKSHMSLETLMDALAANDLSAVREIHLLHLSDDNSDEEMFKDAVQANTGIPVYVAGK